MNKKENGGVSVAQGVLALSPLLVFLLMYLVLSLILGDFYKVPLSVAFIVASLWGVATMRGVPLRRRIDIFSGGAANRDIIYMVWIFILAGAFAILAQKIGATEATVNLTLNVLPAGFLMPGLFLAACFISMAIGTSVGTVVALTPVAVGVAGEIGADVPLFVAIVVGGAFFGDNLSFISDTTITSTRSQGCNMSDKFKVNIWLTLPAAVVILIVYALMGSNLQVPLNVPDANWILVVPYMLVIVTAIAGLNVLLVLLLGIVSSVFFGCLFTDVSLIERLSSGIRGKRGAQAAISFLVGIVNVCTANNTIAIITVGSLAREISEKYGLDNRKTASLLDTCSCVVQCLLPYGAQVLMAASLASVSPVAIVPYLYYPFALGLMVALSILFQFPKRHS